MVEAAIQAGEEDHLEAILAVEASHRPGLKEEEAAAGPLVEEDGHQEAAEAALQEEEVAGRQAEAAGVPREAVREDSLRPSLRQAAPLAPDA